MSLLSIPTVLLLTNDLAPAHAVRQAIRRAGLTLILDPVSTRDEFLSRLRYGAVDVILATAGGIENLSVLDILEETRSDENRPPIVLIGREADERSSARDWSKGLSDFVPFSQFDRLSTVLERVLRRQRDRQASAQARGELDRAAEVLRDNQKLITLGRLSASIAHEINNPLESVTNLLFLMDGDGETPEKRSEYLHMAQRELARVVQISKQTLTFSRETIAPVRVHLSELVEEVLVLYGRRIADKTLHIARQYESNQQVTVYPGEMRQVLSNLIANAIEASGADGELVIRIRTARKWSDEGVQGVRLSVADSGLGITGEVRSRLGEPFFTTKGQHGTGLGLWVTRSILNRYGGNLRLHSSTAAHRHGTVFSLFLPTNMRPQAVLPRGGDSDSPAGSHIAGSVSTFAVEDGELDSAPLASGE